MVKAKLSLCLTKHHAIKTYWGIGDIYISPRILDLGTRWRRVVRLTLRPLYHPGTKPPQLTACEVGWAPEPVWTGQRSIHGRARIFLSPQPDRLWGPPSLPPLYSGI